MRPFSFEEFLQKVFGAAVYVGINCMVLLVVVITPMLALNAYGYLPRHYHAQRVGDYYAVNQKLLANHDYGISMDGEDLYVQFFGYSCAHSVFIDGAGSNPDVGSNALGRGCHSPWVNTVSTDMRVYWNQEFNIYVEANNWYESYLPQYLPTSIRSYYPFDLYLVRERMSPFGYMVIAFYALFWFGMFSLVNMSLAYRMWIQSKTTSKQEK